MVHTTGFNANAIDLHNSKRLCAKIKEKYSTISFYSDIANANIHKLLRPSDQEEKEFVALKLIDKDDRFRHVGEYSQILSTIPRKFYCARIYGDFSEDQVDLRKEVEDFANQEWRNMGGR